MRKVLSILIVFFFSFFLFGTSLAQENKCDNPQSLGLDEIQKCIDELSKAKESSVTATRNLETQVTGIKNRVAFIENDLTQKAKSIEEGYKKLEAQKTLLDKKIVDYYINSYKNCLFCSLLEESFKDFINNLVYQQALIGRDKEELIKFALIIQDLEQRKNRLEAEQKSLASVKADLDKVIADAKIYQNTLSSQIAQLSARQKEILGQRLAALNIPRSAGTSVRGCSDDRGVDPGFSPRIAFFTYGAPHRNGMNQYGAWGRAKAGQNEEQILSEYYPGKTIKKDYNQGIQISTTTGWSGSIEDYVKRIYEVPDSWTDNNLAVLKAQAVAARSYALNVTNNGAKQICTSEQCQVFKPEPKGGNWEIAVEATKGWVLTDGESPAFTQYASTHGGYIKNISKFDGHSGNPGNFSELNDRAYDKESPWFYCDWGARPSYSNTAWLRSSEVADIVNTLLLFKADTSTGEHLYQTDKPNPAGTDTWNEGRVKEELSKRGISSYSSVSSISVSVDFSGGTTNSITLNGDGGSQNFNGSEFKDRFNLRAPANIQIVGPLYNIEQR